MDQKSIISSAEHDITFPLTFSEAVHHLAAQETENFYELNEKQKEYACKKISQHLSVRLRLIFKKLPETINKEQNIDIHSPHRMHLIANALSHQLSDTRANQAYRKLKSIYYSITMCYIQHIHSPFSSMDVPEQWIQNKNFTDSDFLDFHKEFNEKMEKIKTKILVSETTTDKKKLSIKNLAEKIESLPIEAMIEILNDIEQLILTTYDTISKKYIPHSKIRKLLLGIKEYSDAGKYQLLFDNLYHSPIEKALRTYFNEYDIFCGWFDFLGISNHTVRDYLDNSSMGFETISHRALDAVFDEKSNTETEVSQLEFEFFSYLLETIPPRGDQNITNKLSRGKWYILPIEVRNQIVDYIIQMASQPRRLVRFTEPSDLNGETVETTMLSDLQDICLQIRGTLD